MCYCGFVLARPRPAFCQARESLVHKFYQMSDIKGRKTVEVRPEMNMGVHVLGLRTARRAKAPGKKILASGGGATVIHTER